MKIDFAKAALAAVVGTLALDVLGFALTGTFWDIPTLLATTPIAAHARQPRARRGRAGARAAR